MADVAGEAIEYKQWAHTSPRAVFLLVHGLGAHAGRWEAAGDFFAKKGFASYAIELRSFSSPDYSKESFRNFYTRILRLYNIAARETSGKKIFLAGESMGALISFLLTIENPGLFGGLICIAPAFANIYKPLPVDLVRILAPLLYGPQKQFKLPFDSSLCTRDINYQNKMNVDPREYRSASSKIILDIFLAQVRAGIVKKRLKTPALFLIAGEDRIVDARAAKKVFKGLTVQDKTIVEFPGMYHALSIDLGKEKVFEEMLRWAEERI